MSVGGWAPRRISARCLLSPREHKTKVLWIPQKSEFWKKNKKERSYFPRIRSAFIRFSPSDKNSACLVQFLTFRSWQCLFKSTKEHEPCPIHCAQSLWSFSAVPLQPFKLLGESKVHIPAAEGSSLMRCLWLEWLFRWEEPNLFKCLLLSLAMEPSEQGPSSSSLSGVHWEVVFWRPLERPQ